MKNPVSLFFYLILGFCFLSSTGKTQNPDTLAFRQPLERLAVYGDSLLKGKTDNIRLSNHLLFAALVDSILNQSQSWNLSFYQVPALSVLKSPDEKFKIYNWMLTEQDGNAFSYYGYVQLKDQKSNSVRTIHLQEKKYDDNIAVELLKLDSSMWMGAVYYKIIHHHQKKKDYYTLLGWAPHSALTTRKIIEPFVISPNKIIFGAPVLKTCGRAKMRMVFEFNSQTTMSLRFNEKKDMIIFDHLASTDSRPESKGMYNLYGPDLSYDAFKFSNGVWNLKKDIDITNLDNTDGKQPELKKLRVTKNPQQN